MPASQYVHFQVTGHKGKVLMFQLAGGPPPYLLQPKEQIMQMIKSEIMGVLGLQVVGWGVNPQCLFNQAVFTL